MKKILSLFVLVIFLFLSYLTISNYNKYRHYELSAVDTSRTNAEKVSSKELFNQTYYVIKEKYYEPDLNNQNFKKWKKYLKYIKTDEDAYVAINSMIASLNDPYSKFMNKEEFAAQNTNIDSKIYGIGVNIAPASGKIMIVNVIEGTPAFGAGLKVKDIIVKVNEKDINGAAISDVAMLIRGPVGSIVTLELLRDGKKIIKKIKRDEIKITTVKSKIISGDIGYIQVLSFISADMPSEFIDALEKTANTKALIIDLRGNAGGLLPNALFIANMFIKKGNLVTIVDREGTVNKFNAQTNDYNNEKPIVVLTDQMSASASEILGGALKDYKRATLVGTKTYGKGVIQKIFAMPNECGMNLTIARYLTPSGKNIDKIGIQPNYTVNFTENDFKTGFDRQLQFAIGLLHKELAKAEN